MSQYCSSCGEVFSSDLNYCKFCGAHRESDLPGENQIKLEGWQRRFEYGSAQKWSEACASVIVNSDSEEALRANSSFDCSRIPSDGDLVPGDCIWSSIKYPGPLPSNVLGRSFDENLLDDAWVTARPESEIIQVFGEPIVSRKRPWGSVPGEGFSILLFSKSFGFLNRNVKVGGVWFDCYGVALSVETNVSKYMKS